MKHAINIIIASILSGCIGYHIGSVLALTVVGRDLDEHNTITDECTAGACRLWARIIDDIIT